jgi:hypothetical protein
MQQAPARQLHKRPLALWGQQLGGEVGVLGATKQNRGQFFRFGLLVARQPPPQSRPSHGRRRNLSFPV